jgi:hypothetical protein
MKKFKSKLINIFRYSVLASVSIIGLTAIIATGGGGDDNTLEDDYSWDHLGSLGEGWNTRFSVAIDPSDNKPVVVFVDMANNHKAQVMKWSADTTWTDLGYPSSLLADHPCLVIDPSDNKPIVVFQEDNGPDNPTRVMKWSVGTTWTDLGFPSGATGNTLGYWRHPAITIDPSDNKPIVVFVDSDNNYRPQVKKWDTGTTWTDLGFPSTGAGEYPAIAVDPSDNKPVVAYVDNDNGGKVRVMKWSSGTTWIDLGFASTGDASQTAIAIDPSDSKPIVAFLDEVSVRIQIRKWDSVTTWNDLGSPSHTRSDTPSLAIDPSDSKPVVAFRDWAVPPPRGGIHVKKWSSGTTWTGLGWPMPGADGGCAIAIDPSDNKPVVLFNDSTSADAQVHAAKHP